MPSFLSPSLPTAPPHHVHGLSHQFSSGKNTPVPDSPCRTVAVRRSRAPWSSVSSPSDAGVCPQGLMRTGLDKATHGPTGEDQHPTPNNSMPGPHSPFLPSRGPRSLSMGVRALPPPVGFCSVLGPHQICPSRHRSLEKGAPQGFSFSGLHCPEGRRRP